MLARQIIAKSCSLRRLVCRSNMAVSGCSSKYSFFAVIVAIVTVATSSSDPPATCSSDEVTEGETGVITLSFSQEIQFRVEHGVFFSLRRGDDPFILVCSWMDEHSAKECKVANSARGTFHSNGLVDHKVTLVIPNVTLDLQGTYILTGHVKGSQVPPVNCTVTILRTKTSTQASSTTMGTHNSTATSACDTTMGTHNSTATPVTAAVVKEDRPEVVTVVVPVLVMMVVIIIIIIVVLFRHRGSVRNCVGRKRHHDYVATDETDTMTDSEHRTESS